MAASSSRSPAAAHPPAEERDRSTKERLLDAAERLFVARGVAGTSLRAVTADAGANVAAVHYHFGDREALLRAVLARRIDPVNRERLRRLAALERDPVPAPELEAVLEAFLAPVYEAVELRPELSRTVGLLFQEPREEVHALVTELFGEVAERFHAAFGRALPELAPDERMDRFGFVVGAMVHELAGAGPPGVAGLPAPGRAAPQRLARLVRFAAAGLRAPAVQEVSR